MKSQGVRLRFVESHFLDGRTMNTSRTFPVGREELIRIKKILLLIEGFIENHERRKDGRSAGLSRALAVAKAKALLNRVSFMCPMHDVILVLIQSLEALEEKESAVSAAREAIRTIQDYFSLDEIEVTAFSKQAAKE